MPRLRRWGELGRVDAGSAALEFIVAGLILLLPMVYLVVSMAKIQAAAFAVEGAARQAVRVFAQSDTVGEAEARAQRAIEFSLAGYGVDSSNAEVAISCSPHPDDCLSRRGTVTIVVRVSVPLPLVPRVLAPNVPLSVPLEATARERVSRFWHGS